MKRSIALVAAIAATPLYAADLKIGDVTYKNWTAKVEPDGLTILHSNGAVRIPMENLPPELKAKYQLDPVKAAEYRKQKAAKRKLKAADINQRIAGEKARAAADAKRAKWNRRPKQGGGREESR